METHRDCAIVCIYSDMCAGYKLVCETRWCACSLSSPSHSTPGSSCSSSKTRRTVPLQTTPTWTPHSLQSWAQPLQLTVQSWATPLQLTVQTWTPPLQLTVQSWATPLWPILQSRAPPLRLTIYAWSWTPLTKPLPTRGPRCYSPSHTFWGGEPVWCHVHQLSVGESPTTPPGPRLAPPSMIVCQSCFKGNFVYILELQCQH